ncbi:hypothetical protein MJD09_26580 [bacterium]|nr:hypothetical protein [bacterium]
MRDRAASPEGSSIKGILSTATPLQSAWDRLWSEDGLGANTALANLTPGAAYSLETENGLVLQGQVRTLHPPMEFLSTLENHNNGHHAPSA